MAIGIIILNYNNCKYTVQCINSIEQHNSADIKYIVIDNGSTQEEDVKCIHSFLESTFPEQYLRVEDTDNPLVIPRACFITSRNNDGYAEGNNKGLRIAFNDIDIEDILILNNDIFFHEDILPTLLSYKLKLKNPGILTPLLYNLDGSIEYNCARAFPSNWEVMLPFVLFKKDFFHILSKLSNSQKILISNPKLLIESSFPIGMPSGACMFFNKNLLIKSNGFDNGTFLYYEENILCKKLSQSGLINYCIPSITAIHVGGVSTSKSNNLFLQKCNLQSADYYLKAYGGMSLFQRITWVITVVLWNLKFKIKNL